MSGADTIDQLRAAGFSDADIQGYVSDERKTLEGAGFTETQINEHFGQPPINEQPMWDFAKETIDSAMDDFLGPDNEDGERPDIFELMERGIKQGYQSSVTGLIERGKMPEPAEEDVPMLEGISRQLGTLGGDLPVMVPSAIITSPGGPVTSMATAFAMPAGLRKALMDAYQKGEVVDFGDWFQRQAAIMLETAKGAVTGASTAMAGGAAKTAVGKIGAEITTMVTVGKGLEGEVPTAKDFFETAVLLYGFKGATVVTGKGVTTAQKATVRGQEVLQDIYSKTGKRPKDIVADMKDDPTILEDVIAAMDPNARQTPRAYEPLVEVPISLRKMTHAEAKKEIGPGRLSKDGATHFFEIQGGKAGTQANLTVIELRDGRLRIEDIVGDRGAGTFGAARMRQISDVLAKEFPNATHIVGERVSGARQAGARVQEGEGVEVSIPIRRRAAPEVPKTPEPPPLTSSPEVNAAVEKVLSKISVGKHDRQFYTFEDIYIHGVDKLYPLHGLVKKLAAGEKIDANLDPYKQARFVPAASAKAQLFLDYEVRQYGTTNVVSRGLKDILDPVKADLREFKAYIASKRALELSKREIDPGVDAVAAKTTVDALGGKYEPVFRELVGFQDAVTQYLRDSGVISKEAYTKMQEANKDYVPFFRLFDEATPSGLGGSMRNPIKRIKGSERDVIDPIESIIKNTYLYTQLAERNAVGVKLVELAERKGGTKGEDALITKEPTTVKPIKVDPKEMSQIAKDVEAEFGVKFTPDELTIFRANSLNPGEGQIAVFRDGKREIYNVGKDVAEAMNGMDAQSANMFVRLLSLPAKTLRAGAILNPEFFAKNPMRDTVSATIFSTAGFRPFVDTVMGGMSLLSKDTAFRDWMMSGGANATLVSLDRQYLQQSLKKLTEQTGFINSARNVVTSPLEILRVGAELSENATRLGLYKRKTRGRRDPKSMAEGGFESREGTLDFARMGASMKGWNGISAFLNARVQGYDRAVRAFIDNPGRATSLAFATITIPSIALWVVNHDDPRYKAIPQWQKDMFWIVLTEDNIYRVPKPFEPGIIFGTVPEHLLEGFVADNPEALATIKNAFYTDTLSTLVPNMLGPFFEQQANFSVFRQSPLIPARLEGLVPDMQYTEYTTELAKALSRATSFVEETLGANPADAGVSPIILENYVRQWTGGLGNYVLQLADKGLREAGLVPDPVRPADTLADIPFVKAFVIRYPSGGAEPIKEFYERLNQAKVVRTSVDKLIEEGEFDRADEIDALDPGAIVDLDDIRKTLGEQAQEVRMIYKNPDIPRDEKRQLIDSTYYFMIELAQDANEIMREASEPLK